MRILIKWLLIIGWIAIIITPPLVYVNLQTPAALSRPGTAFPIFGLIAFTLIWSQIMLGAFMRPLSNYFPNIFNFHIIQGLTALTFAILHPLFLLIAHLPNWLDIFNNRTLVPPGRLVYVTYGKVGFLLLILGVLAGLLRKWPPVQRYWHWIHLVNYLVFFFILVHSVGVEGDLILSPILQSLWFFFFVTVIIAIIYRRITVPLQHGLVASTQ